MERKSWKLWILVILAVVMVCVTAGSVADAEDNGEIQVILTEEAEKAQTASMDVDTERSAELFVDRAVYGTRLRGVTLKGASLTGGSKNLYDRLRADIIAVANGADGCDGSTVFVYSLDEIYSQSSFTEDDLHTAIVVNGKISDAATAAVSAKYASEMDFDAVTDCLMQDCVYELYWYDKTENGGCNERENYHYGAQTVNGNWVLTVSGQVTVSFAVSEDYAVITNNGNGTYSMDPYAVDVAKYGQAARQAAANAQNIVSAHENESNYQRLLSYKNAICTETDYNHDAAEDDDTAYGDPWQLVWVFDENPVTKVVCEGYSKAFKYLNDLSANTDVDVILAEGTMEGATGSGPHMWNIVRMEDGRNYMADITNCDAGSVGYPDLLFLTGPASGNVTDGYIFSTGNSSVSYVYSNNNYSEERITLDEHGYLYNQDHPACEHTNCEWEYSWAQGTTFTPDEWNWGHHITGTRIESLVCQDCRETLQTDSSQYTDYYESHTYNNQLIGPDPAVCEICGHINNCIHESTTENFNWLQDCQYQDDKEDNYQHSLIGKADVWTVCSYCGIRMSDVHTENQYTYKEPHSYNGEGVCSNCGHVNTCAHEHTNTSYFNENVSCSAITGDNYFHNVTGTGDYTVTCTDCWMTIDQQLNTDISRTEGHRYNSDSHTCEDCGHECSHEFDESGWCDACGYQCYHDGINNQPVTPIQQEGPFYSYDDEDHHCVYATKTVYGRQCPHCPYIERDWVSGEEYPETYTVELHTYEDGVCSKCGVKCPHTQLNQAEIQAWNPTEPQVIALNEIYHVQALATGTYRICPDCGEMIFRTKEIAAGVDPDTLEKTAHDFDSNGLCDECGYQCPHESYTNGICDNCHKVCMHSFPYGAGVCLICGYHCPHTDRENIETTGTEYEWASTTQHNKLTVSTSYYRCNKCPYTSTPVRTISEQPENHTDPDNDGICDVCQRAINGNFNYDVNSGVLRITGNGAIPDYPQISDLPWYEQIRSIKRVFIEGDFTAIGTNVLNGLGSETRIDFRQRRMPEMDTTGISGVCRYYSTDASWSNAPDSWVYLPVFNPDWESMNRIEYHAETGWSTGRYGATNDTDYPLDNRQAWELSYTGRNVVLYSLPTGDDLKVITEHFDTIWTISFQESCAGKWEITLPEETNTGLSIDVYSPNLELIIDGHNIAKFNRILIGAGTAVYTGDVQNLYLRNTTTIRTGATLTVNGNVASMDLYDSTSDAPYIGSVTVNGTIQTGSVYGTVSIAIPHISDNVVLSDMIKTRISNVQQSTPVVQNGELTVAGAQSIDGLTYEDFDLTYHLYSDGWRLGIHPKEGSALGTYGANIDDIEKYNPNFSTADIIWGENTKVYVFDVRDKGKIVFNGGENGEGLGSVTLEACIADINCPVNLLHVSQLYTDTEATTVTINGPVENLMMTLRKNGNTVTLGEEGNVETGSWNRFFDESRFFGQITEPCDIYSEDRLKILSWKEGQEIQALLPPDRSVTEAAGTNAMMDLDQVTLNDLTADETSALNTFLEAQESGAAATVFDASVSSVIIDADGNVYKGQSISKLNKEVPVVVNNQVNGPAYIVRLHADNAGTVVAEQMCEETEDELLSFNSSLFSKYVIVAANGQQIQERELQGPENATWYLGLDSDQSAGEGIISESRIYYHANLDSINNVHWTIECLNGPDCFEMEPSAESVLDARIILKQNVTATAGEGRYKITCTAGDGSLFTKEAAVRLVNNAPGQIKWQEAIYTPSDIDSIGTLSAWTDATENIEMLLGEYRAVRFIGVGNQPEDLSLCRFFSSYYSSPMSMLAFCVTSMYENSAGQQLFDNNAAMFRGQKTGQEVVTFYSAVLNTNLKYYKTIRIAVTKDEFGGFVLPSGTTVIEANAFEGIAAEAVRIPDDCTTIGASAFAGSNLKKIWIPASVTSIGSNAFPAGTVIYMPVENNISAELRQRQYTVITPVVSE